MLTVVHLLDPVACPKVYFIQAKLYLFDNHPRPLPGVTLAAWGRLSGSLRASKVVNIKNYPRVTPTRENREPPLGKIGKKYITNLSDLFLPILVHFFVRTDGK